MILALALSPSLDLTYEIAQLRRGEINRPDAVTRVAGGKALNAARAAHAFGADVIAVAALGGATGDWIAELLAAEGVALQVVPIGRPTRLCSALVEHDGGESSTDVYEAATPLDAAEWLRYRDAVVAADESAWIVLSGSVPQGVPLAELRELLEELRLRGARVALDSSGPSLVALAPAADLVKINRAEASALVGDEFVDAASAAGAVSRIVAADVVVTDGVRGGHALVGGASIALPPPEMAGRFSAGSGDAFLGGLLAALDEGCTPRAALEQARRAAERNARVPGQARLA